jgi:hypothetical protein
MDGPRRKVNKHVLLLLLHQEDPERHQQHDRQGVPLRPCVPLRSLLRVRSLLRLRLGLQQGDPTAPELMP